MLGIVQSEEEIQADIVTTLKMFQFEILSISRRGTRTRGGRVYGADGVSRGAPDLFCRHPSWPIGIWLPMEVKRVGGKWSNDEQPRLYEAGAIPRVESVAQALCTIWKFCYDSKPFSPPNCMWSEVKKAMEKAEHGFFEVDVKP